jgi:hypothetical protein
MQALESASVDADVRPFAGFVADRILGSSVTTLKQA